MVTPHLPQEIIEDIIDDFVGDKKNLLSCALVSSNWVDRCRHHLFANVKLNSLPRLQSWFKIGLGASSHHVRSLNLTQDDQTQWITPDTLAGILDDFTTFRNVRFLAFTGVDFTLFDEYSLTRLFGHFSEHLTSLSIRHATVIPEMLLFFVCMFPELDNLGFDNITIGNAALFPRNLTIPAITPRFRGKLALLNIKSDGTTLTAPFLDPPLPMAFKDLHVENCRFESPKPLRDLFVACSETVRALKISRIFLDDTSQAPLIDLSPFKGLEELGLSLIKLNKPSQWVEPILQTVTSHRIRKISFDTDIATSVTDIGSVVNLPSWASLDAMFLTIADKLDPNEHKLELVFNAMKRDSFCKSQPVELGRFLERCRVKAVVRLGHIQA